MAVIPKETRESHEDYLAIFSQTMILMPNIFSFKQDVIWMISFSFDSCYSYNISLKASNFLLLTKKQSPINGTTYLVNDFSLFANFPSTKFWSSYITWLYIKRTKVHTKGGPIHAKTSLILLQNTHFHTSPSLLQSPSS